MSRMECTQIDDLLMDYLYQELAPEQAEEFRAHLDSCVRCAREVQSLQGVREAVRELPVLEPPKALTAQLLHRAAEAKKPAFPWLKSLWELLQPRRTFYAVAAAASLLVVLLVGYTMRQGQLQPAFPTEERAVTAEAPAPAARPAAPTALPPSVASPLGAASPDEPKVAGAKAALGGEAENRAIDGLAEKDAKLAANQGTGEYPVRLDKQSVQREQAAGVDPGWDSSNAARVADARRGGFGLQGRAEPPADQSIQREGKRSAVDGERPVFAQMPKQQAPVAVRLPQAVARGAQAAPVINAPAGGPAAGPQRLVQAEARPPAPAQVQTKRSWQEPRVAQAPAAAAPAPAAAKEEAESGYYRRQGGGGQAAAPPTAPARPRHVETTTANRDENARDQVGDGHGFAQAPPDERTRMRAAVDYKNALGVGCEKQIKLLEDFITKYPWDNRVKEAKIRIAVCRARLTGQSDDVDDVLRNIEGDRQKKSLHEAEQRATPDRYAPTRKAPPSPVSLERQTYKARKAAPKPAARPPRAEPVQQALKAPAAKSAPAAKPAPAAEVAKAKGKAPAEKPAATAKAPAKPAAGSTASAAKAKKAPAKADEGAKKAPAAATTSK
jgi:hypothetical protein